MAFRYTDYRVIVSIDFGTTFSGTCYAATGQYSQKELESASYGKITHVTDWPEQSLNEHKTPSINIYDRNFHLLYWGKVAFDKIKHGEVEKDQRVVEKFKLDLPSSVAQKGAIHQTGNKNQKELLNFRAAIDYFREVYDHTVSAIQNEFNFIKDSKIEKEHIRFVITVPAQWNDVQRAIMRNVAKEAGLISDEDHENRLLVINESLAATLYCERENSGAEATLRHGAKNPNGGMYENDLKEDDKYIICDAGGGTVDLATFESTASSKTAKNDSFRRCQLTADSGDRCGSVFLDEQMQKLLLSIFFGLDEPQNKEKEEQKMYEKLIAPFMETFINKIKPTFGKRCDLKKINCEHKKQPKLSADSDESDESDNEESKDKENEEQCQQCEEDEFMYVNENDFGSPTRFIINGGNIENHLKLTPRFGVKIVKPGPHSNDNKTTISISYELMRKVVFDQVIESTLHLLKRQVDKANGKIKRTYLVGGFGCSPYLQKRVKERFTKNNNCEIGELVVYTRGDTAAMRGAMYYGIDGSRRPPQSDIAINQYNAGEIHQFEVLICLDVGYNGTACSYRDLNNTLEKDMKEITEWPGSNTKRFAIPTALDRSGDKPLWGAQVSELTNLNPETLIVPSKLMATVKSELRMYLTKYLQLLDVHIYNVISKENPQLSDKSKYRYVITMENCYQFFNSKLDMRRIAKEAGIIGKDDPVERLLLIHRENSAAMFYEKKYFSDQEAFSSHFLQINLYHDTCHLALHEATRIAGCNKEDYENKKNEEETLNNTKYFRNVRSMRSATFAFNFIGKIVRNLDSFVSKTDCISCSASPPHNTYNTDYYTGLREGFLNYIKDTLDFSNNDKDQLITIITKSGRCEISITVYDLLEQVFRPAIRDLSSEINRFATQVDMAQRFQFDKIFLSGILVEALPNTYAFLERILIKNLSEVMNIGSDIIIAPPKEDNGKEALLGAAHYGNHPIDFTERVSRKSYVVNVRAFVPKEFSQEVKDEIAKLKNEIDKAKDEIDKAKARNDKYDIEAMNALIDESQEVELYHQSAYNPSLKNDKLKRLPKQGTFLIHRGDKITEKDQMKGISKRFYAEKECIVYATIYTSEMIELPKPEDEVNVDLSKFQKIHQFEIYVKRDDEDPMTRAPNSRLHFDVRLIPDNNEAKFEANVSSRLGKKIPEFRFRDEILVANIYGDEKQIRVDDLSVDAHNSDVDALTSAVEKTEIPDPK